jgi:hypothetical protein
MNVRAIAFLAAVFILPVLEYCVAHIDAQTEDCSPALRTSDPAYRDALVFARVLATDGFTVECMAPSKMTGTFEGQLGATLYRTKQGSFEALFLPNPQDFDGLQVRHQQVNGRYRYSFAGHPKPWPANLLDAARPVYFLNNRNRLIVTQDKQLFGRLSATLAQR